MRLRLALLGLGLLIVPLVHAEGTACFALKADPPPHVDMDRVRREWLRWNNRLRTRLHLQPFKLNPYLNATAMNWSAYAVQRGTIDHRRTPQSSYYDYGAIESWFRMKGLRFTTVSGRTFTENIGWGPYSCNAADCTDTLIDAIRSTYGFFLSERAQNGPHYRSLVSDGFQQVGLGVAVSPAQGRYYLTVHYATVIASDPPAVCEAQQ